MAGTQGHIIDDARKRVVIRSDRDAIIDRGRDENDKPIPRGRMPPDVGGAF